MGLPHWLLNRIVTDTPDWNMEEGSWFWISDSSGLCWF